VKPDGLTNGPSMGESHTKQPTKTTPKQPPPTRAHEPPWKDQIVTQSSPELAAMVKSRVVSRTTWSGFFY